MKQIEEWGLDGSRGLLTLKGDKEREGALLKRLEQIIEFLKNDPDSAGSQLKESSLRSLSTGMKSGFFDQRKREINQILRKTLGTALAKKYEIQAVDQGQVANNNKAKTVYGVKVESRNIKEEWSC